MENAVNIAVRTPGPDALTSGPSPTAKPEEAASGADFFWNLLDVINPLQHIPVISTIYRALTGDEISPAAKLAGGTLFGGPLGAAAAIASIAVEGATGNDVGELVLAAITGKDAPAPDNQLAQAPVAPLAQTAALLSPEPPRDTIIWNGMRQLPQLASLADPAPTLEAPSGEPAAIPPATALAPPPKTKQPTPDPSADAQPAADPGRAAQPGKPAAAANVSATWLTTALTQAETLETANAKGDASVRFEAQPWLADAMMQALDQYESLAKQRQRQGDADNRATGTDMP